MKIFQQILWLVVLACGILYAPKSEAQLNVSGNYHIDNVSIHYNDETGPYVIDTFTVVPDVIVHLKLANTGLSYNKQKHHLIIGYFGNTSLNYISIIDRRNRIVKQIDVNTHIDNIQGIAYDERDSTYWVWALNAGMPSGVFQTNPDTPGYSYYSLFQFNEDGELLESIPTTVDIAYPGCINIDIEANTIWMKACNRKFAKLYDMDTWDVLRVIDFDVSGEGISTIEKDSSFMVADGGFLYHFSHSGVLIDKKINPVENRQAEGLLVDPTDGTIWFNADEYFHGLIENGNRLWHIDYFGTYDKNFKFPEMATFTSGDCQNCEIDSEGKIQKIQNSDSSIWSSPVIDYEEHRPMQISIETNANYEIQYRGSQNAPTTLVNDNFAVDYYDATQQNLGWGNTEVSDWQIEVPDARYIQFRLIIKPSLVINEMMVNYTSTITDEYGETDDWIEICNLSDKPLNLADNILFNENQELHQLPELTINPNEHIVFWLDNQPHQGENHFPFLLRTFSFASICGSTPAYPHVSYGLYPDKFGQNELLFPTIGQPNDSPNIPPQYVSKIPDYECYEDTKSFIVVDNIVPFFTDLDEDELSYGTTILSPGLDSARMSSTDELIVYPTPNFFGAVDILVSATDIENETITDTIRGHFHGINDAPVAAKEQYSTIEDMPIIINAPGILQNDFDIDRDLLIPIIHTYPNHGIIQLEDNGAFIYTPFEDFYGKDSLIYYVYDGELQSNMVTVVFTTVSINDCPIIEITEPLVFLEDDMATFDFSEFITDVDNTLSEISIFWSGNSIINIEQAETQITFSSNEQNWHGSEEIMFYVTDDSLIASTTMKIKCISVNDLPVILPVDNKLMNEDEFVVADFSELISDADHSISELTLSFSNSELLIIEQQDLTATFRPKHENWNGNETITVHLSDGIDSDLTTFEVICFPVNDPPTIQLPENLNSHEGEVIIFDIQDYISDIDNTTQSLIIKCMVGDNYRYVSNGYTYTFIPIDDNWFGNVEVVFSVEDGEFVVKDTINIQCIAVNDPPYSNIPEDVQYIEDDSITINFATLIGDIDSDINDLFISFDGNNMVEILPQNKIFTFKNSIQNWYGYEDVNFYVTDGQNIVLSSMIVNVVPVNDSPVFSEIGLVEFYEDGMATVDIYDFITDVDTEMDDISIKCENNLHINARMNGNSLEFYSVLDNWSGSENITVSIDDGEFQLEQEIQVNCIDINDPPQFLLPSEISFLEDGSVVIDIFDFVSDVDNSADELSFWWNPMDNIIITNDDWLVNFSTERPNWNGTAQTTFYVTDGIDIVAMQLNIECQPVGDLPIFDIPAELNLFEDKTKQINLLDYISDVDGTVENIEISWEETENIDITNENWLLSISSSQENWHGSEMIIINAREQGVGKVTDTIQVTFMPVNDKPVLMKTTPDIYQIYTYVDSVILFEVSVLDIENNLTYQWNIDDTRLVDSLQNMKISFAKPGTYFLKQITKDEEYSTETNWQITVQMNNFDEPDIIGGNKIITAFPNPFEDEVRIDFALANTSIIDISVFDTKGNKILVLANNKQYLSGLNHIFWSGIDSQRNRVKPGIYIVEFRFGTETHTLNIVKK